MNKLFTLLLSSTVLFLASCGGGWSDDQKNMVKNECITEGGYDCDCYVDKAVETFKNPEAYNAMEDAKKEAFNTAIEDCEVEEEAVDEENLESF
ncbi:hypothetical protein CW751_07495 [Brumimicrobium salinarum]|uniref:Lipoprotein n=1 Tax=Brumimicrobium salinarum TaxID=2058658 RepID=A0A2I0R340_9FLAO|nr:hypothetical protein [Brumimicrobium salinarum]PKR81002.1 hypothetical protein CW751_07495 [Brumimicrobium salinarum]